MAKMAMNALVSFVIYLVILVTNVGVFYGDNIPAFLPVEMNAVC